MIYQDTYLVEAQNRIYRVLQFQFSYCVSVNILTTDTTNTIAQKLSDAINNQLNDTANGVYRYKSTVNNNKITVTSQLTRVEPSPTLNVLTSGITYIIDIVQNGTVLLPQIFELTINTKANMKSDIILNLNNEPTFVDKKRISSTSINNNFVLVLNPRTSMMKQFIYDGYNGSRKKDITVYIYCLAKTPEESTVLSSRIESWINKNQTEFSTYSPYYQDIRFGQITNVAELADEKVLGYSASTSNICANVLVFNGYTMY